MATGEHAPFIAYVDSKCSHFSVCQCCDSQHTDQCAQSERDSDANAPSDCYHCLASRPHRILVSPVKMCVRKPGQFVVGRQTGSWRKRGSRKLACHFNPKQLKLAPMLEAPPMNPFFYSEEAGAKGLPPLSPAPQPPPNLPPLRSGQFRLTIPNTYSTITMPASLRSDCCSTSLRNAVRLPSGTDVHLHRNTQ